MSDNEIERIRRDHIADPDGDPNDPHCVTCSSEYYPIWPCDAALLLALLAERDAEIKGLVELGERMRRTAIDYAANGGDVLRIEFNAACEQWRAARPAAQEGRDGE